VALSFQVQFEFSGSNLENISLPLIMGDGTGWIHIQDGQVFYIEYSEFQILRSAPPCNFIVNAGAGMMASADFRVVGEALPAIQLDGHLAGVINITLANEAEVWSSETASNSQANAEGNQVTLPNGKCGAEH
jgi:hypothetical protein